MLLLVVGLLVFACKTNEKAPPIPAVTKTYQQASGDSKQLELYDRTVKKLQSYITELKPQLSQDSDLSDEQKKHYEAKLDRASAALTEEAGKVSKLQQQANRDKGEIDRIKEALAQAEADLEKIPQQGNVAAVRGAISSSQLAVSSSTAVELRAKFFVDQFLDVMLYRNIFIISTPADQPSELRRIIQNEFSVIPISLDKFYEKGVGFSLKYRVSLEFVVNSKTYCGSVPLMTEGDLDNIAYKDMMLADANDIIGLNEELIAKMYRATIAEGACND